MGKAAARTIISQRVSTRELLLAEKMPVMAIQSQETADKLLVETDIVGGWEVAHLGEDLPGMMKAWVPSPGLHKTKCFMHRSQRWRWENQEFKVSLGYIVSSKPA